MIYQLPFLNVNTLTTNHIQKSHIIKCYSGAHSCISGNLSLFMSEDICEPWESCFPELPPLICLIFGLQCLTNIPLCPLGLLHCLHWAFGLYFCEFKVLLNFNLSKFCGGAGSRRRFFLLRSGVRAGVSHVAQASWLVSQTLALILRPNLDFSVPLCSHISNFWGESNPSGLRVII